VGGGGSPAVREEGAGRGLGTVAAGGGLDAVPLHSLLPPDGPPATVPGPDAQTPAPGRTLGPPPSPRCCLAGTGSSKQVGQTAKRGANDALCKFEKTGDVENFIFIIAELGENDEGSTARKKNMQRVSPRS